MGIGIDGDERLRHRLEHLYFGGEGVRSTKIIGNLESECLRCSPIGESTLPSVFVDFNPIGYVATIDADEIACNIAKTIIGYDIGNCYGRGAFIAKAEALTCNRRTIGKSNGRRVGSIDADNICGSRWLLVDRNNNCLRFGLTTCGDFFNYEIWFLK